MVNRFEKKQMKYTVKTLDLNDRQDSAFALMDGDTVEVYESNEQADNSIVLEGNVYFPGTYEFKKGMRISDIVKNSDDVLEDTQMDSAYLVRRDSSSSEAVLISFNLQNIFNNVNSKDNHMLMPMDRIMIVNKYDILDNIEINVSGEVVYPGKVISEKEDTVYKLITKAGGFTSASNINSIEIIKYDKGSFTSEVIDVNKAMAMKAPPQGYILVHGIYENISEGRVEISGDVMTPGEYVFYDGMKISDLLKRAISKREYSNEYTLLYYMTSSGGEKTIFKIDINGINDPKADRELGKGDRIEVSLQKKANRAYVNIEGAVYDTALYIYGTGMTVTNLISMAGGLTESAYSDEVEIIRKKIKGHHVQQDYIVVRKRDYDRVKLEQGDSIVVKNIMDFNKTDYVTLKGEFVFPGVYPIKRGERLSSIIRRAGGFTDHAYLYGAVFTRVKVKRDTQAMVESMIEKLERELTNNANLQAMTAVSNATLNSSELFLKTKDSFIESLQKIKADGRVVINIDHPRLLKGSVNDVILENMDTITIPRKEDYVTVSGAVLNQGAFIYNEKMDWADYVKIAGGYLKNADKDNIYIMKANGTVQRVTDKIIAWSPENERWEVSMFSEKKMLQAGDNIIVPDDYSRVAWLRNIKDVTQILMQIAVTGGVAANLF